MPISCETEPRPTSWTRSMRRVRRRLVFTEPAALRCDQIRYPVIGLHGSAAVTLSPFAFSCGGLQRGAGLWRQAGNQRRSGASTEAAENLPEEGLLQDPRRQQVTAEGAPVAVRALLLRADLSDSALQERQQAGDHQGLQEAGTAVAPWQLPVRGGQKGGGEEVYWHRLSKRGPDRPRSGADLLWLLLSGLCAGMLQLLTSFFPEMRQKFDAGEDPLDPENQQGGGGRDQPWPFHFDPFQSGGSFHFKFQYNWEESQSLPHTDAGEAENSRPASISPGLADYLNIKLSEKRHQKKRICVWWQLLRRNAPLMQHLQASQIKWRASELLLICLFHSLCRGTFLTVAQDWKGFFWLQHNLGRW